MYIAPGRLYMGSLTDVSNACELDLALRHLRRKLLVNLQRASLHHDRDKTPNFFQSYRARRRLNSLIGYQNGTYSVRHGVAAAANLVVIEIRFALRIALAMPLTFHFFQVW